MQLIDSMAEFAAMPRLARRIMLFAGGAIFLAPLQHLDAEIPHDFLSQLNQAWREQHKGTPELPEWQQSDLEWLLLPIPTQIDFAENPELGVFYWKQVAFRLSHLPPETPEKGSFWNADDADPVAKQTEQIQKLALSGRSLEQIAQDAKEGDLLIAEYMIQVVASYLEDPRTLILVSEKTDLVQSTAQRLDGWGLHADEPLFQQYMNESLSVAFLEVLATRFGSSEEAIAEADYLAITNPVYNMAAVLEGPAQGGQNLPSVKEGVEYLHDTLGFHLVIRQDFELELALPYIRQAAHRYVHHHPRPNRLHAWPTEHEVEALLADDQFVAVRF